MFGWARDVLPLEPAMIFTAFFVMLGPVKIVGPFTKLTAGMGERERRALSIKAIVFACGGGAAAAVLGQSRLDAWRISPPALTLTAGIILFVVALKAVLDQYEPPTDPAAPVVAPRNPALSPLAFPTILTPHGIAALILVLALTRDARGDAFIVGLFLVVMAMNLAIMQFARWIVLRGGVVLAVVGSVFGVLQVALAVQMMMNALREMHVLPPA